MSFTQDAVSATIRTALDGLSARQRVVADNIANIDTPGFTARKVEFETALQGAVSEGSMTLGQVSPTTSARSTPVGPNGNNVDLATETLAATQSLFQYQMMTRAVSDRTARVTTVLGGA
ncbi:flagellar basal body rod protein FlgB [Solicola sp. PLA-1-18]|uniref:flagellar basal body rod protein FlgB n=1 Tax=Solicola sp. PLA-1-18 TaxID=3380532 RepID=UPI003B79E595